MDHGLKLSAAFAEAKSSGAALLVSDLEEHSGIGLGSQRELPAQVVQDLRNIRFQFLKSEISMSEANHL